MTDTAVILTGATGFLGGRMLKRLLPMGLDLFVLARSRQGIPAEQRVRALVRSSVDDAQARTLHVIDADLSNLSVADVTRAIRETLGTDRATRILLVNVAASLRMDHPAQPENKRLAIQEQNHATNVVGLERLLQVLDDLSDTNPSHGVVHISTCYAHGQRTGLLPEGPLDPVSACNNSYEQTKRLGETVVETWHERTSVPTTIIRPSIVTGEDTDDGYVTWLDALSETDSDGQRAIDKALAPFIRCRIRRFPVPGNADGILDFIDASDVEHYSCEVVRLHLEKDAMQGIRHLQLANPGAPTLRQVGELTLRGLGYEPSAMRAAFIDLSWLFSALSSLVSAIPAAGRAFRNILGQTAMLRPYLGRTTGTTFSTARTREFFEERGVVYRVQPIDQAYVSRLISRRASLRRQAALATESVGPVEAEASSSA